METRKIGSLNASVVGLGCNNFGWKIDEAESSRVVDAALDAGVNFFDTADRYGETRSEEFLGRILKGRRDKVVLATKFGSRLEGKLDGGAKPNYIKRAIEGSLKRLGTDYVDLYQIHTPDPDTPVADTLAALNELVQAGKVREIGCSNFSAAQLQEAESAAQGGARFVSVQNEYSLLKRKPEADVLPVCEELSIGFLPYFPLASGLLSGKYRAGQPLPEGTRIQAGGGGFAGLLTESNLVLVEKLVAFSEARGHSILDLAFSWLLRQAAVSSVIAGATSPAQVKANAAADWHLEAADLAEIDAILAAGLDKPAADSV